VVTVQRAFRAKYAKNPPTDKTIRDRVFVPTLPRELVDLKARIIAAVQNIDALMLTCAWQELEYRIDVCLPCQLWCTHRTFLVDQKK
jgi:hypothetical protein